MASKLMERRLLEKIDVDAEALKLLLNTDGESFIKWAERTRPLRQTYEGHIRNGYPARPEQAEAVAPSWEGWLGYAQEQAAVANAYLVRALGVSREILAHRGVRATESAAEARTWEQREETNRWEAIVETLREWLYEARGREKIKQRPGGPGR